MNTLYSQNKHLKSENYSLFLDDDANRIPQKLHWIDLPWANWLIVRNYDEFVECIERNGIPLRVSFDHDLAENHYQEYHRANESDRKLNYDNYKEKTGYHCAIFLVEYCIDHKVLIPEYTVHSMNHMGKLNIVSALESGKKVIGQ